MDKIKLLFAGDFCIRLGGVENLTDEKIDEVSTTVKNITAEYDVSVVNVETVFTDEPTPAAKSGPAISSPVKALELLKKMNFTVGAFANNHTCDQGEKQGLESIEMVKNAGMKTVGAGKNLCDANKPLRFEIKGKKISILNFAEHEFTAATHSSFGFAPVDFYDNGKLVEKEKQECDYVFVMLHAGNEHCPFPRSGVKKLSRHLVDMGADGVIIAHPHTPQGYEYYKEKPIIYSMGNFFMSKTSDSFSLWNVGYMADITITEDKIEFVPIPYEFGSLGQYFEVLSGEKKEKFIKYLDELCDIISNASEEEYKNLEYAWSILNAKDYWNGCVKNMWSDLAHKLSTSGETDQDAMLFIKNAFSCESHNEAYTNFFELFVGNRLNDFEEQTEKIKNWQQMPY